jgi:hypothetical protein
VAWIGLAGAFGLPLTARAEPPPDAAGAAGHDRSYLLPAAEIVAINLGVHAFDRWVLNEDYAEVTWETIEHNLHPDSWRWDPGDFSDNQLGHAYLGSTYYTSARSSGLGGWASFGYTVGGSLLWELFGERSSPSINDQITTPVAGTLLGEALYQLHLQAIGRIEAGFWREAAALVAAPMAEMNRALFDDRFRPLGAERRTSAYGELEVGAAARNQDADWNPVGQLAAHFLLGVPGDPELRLPGLLGHHDIRAGLMVEEDGDTAGSVQARGLFWGRTFAGASGSGLWGVFGQYDYTAPGPFRVSATGLGLGTSATWRADRSSVGGTALVSGIAYGAGSINPRTDTTVDEHFGQGVLGTLEGRAIWADRVRLELTARDYFIAGTIDSAGYENATLAAAGLTVRVFRGHGVGLRAQWAHRRSHLDDISLSQDEAALSVSYQLLGPGLGGPY